MVRQLPRMLFLFAGCAILSVCSEQRSAVTYDNQSAKTSLKSTTVNVSSAKASNDHGYYNSLADLDSTIRLNPEHQEPNKYPVEYDPAHEREIDVPSHDKPLHVDPAGAESYADRAALDIQRKDYKQAILDLNNALTLDPTNVKASMERGFVYETENRYAFAFSDFDQVVRFHPDNPR
jgi:tetratricopeptide (TPR) repeat protein